jgi:hypothetical protein
LQRSDKNVCDRLAGALLFATLVEEVQEDRVVGPVIRPYSYVEVAVGVENLHLFEGEGDADEGSVSGHVSAMIRAPIITPRMNTEMMAYQNWGSWRGLRSLIL